MPFKNREDALAYLAENKERRYALAREWEQANRERRNKYKRERRSSGLERKTPEQRKKTVEYNRQWRESNRERYRAYQSEWRARNPDHAKRETARMRTREYGLTPEQFETLEQAQGGLCAICAQPPKGSLHVDHCHVSGEVRGLLCGKCNRGLGMFNDDGALLVKASMYLRRYAKNFHSA